MEPQAKSISPVMDVVAPPSQEHPAATLPPSGDTPVKSKPETPKAAVKAKSSQPKDKGNGVALAIFATVIIILGLGALTVFAYLKQIQRI